MIRIRGYSVATDLSLKEMVNLITDKQAEMRRNIFSAAFLAEKIRGNEARFLFGIALLTRLIALPFSQVMESDATNRMFLAEHALHNGGELTSLQWPSFHIYLLSLSQFIFQDRLWGPVIISLLMGAISVVPFYRFTKNIFNKDGAFYAALIFIFSPLIFRLSFVPLSEIYHVCFSITALWCLSEGIVRKEKKIKWGILAGLAATMAAGGRFEAWVLIGLLGIIILFFHEWKMMLAFGIVASVFPVYWLVYCYRLSGNPLISLQMVEWQNFVVGKVNDSLNELEYTKRIVFFPFSWIISITPIIGFMSIGLFAKAIFRKKITKAQFLFGGLFFFFLPFFMYESITGALADQHRYSVTLVMLSTPFFALWFKDDHRIKFRKYFSIIVVVLIIPWSYSWQRIPWHKLGFVSKMQEQAIAEIVGITNWQSTAIPNFHNPEIKEISDEINKSLLPGDGLFIDFVDWCETFYFAQRAPLDLHDQHIVPPVTPHNGDNKCVKNLFDKHPQGLILLGDFSSYTAEETLTGPILEFSGVEGGVRLSPIITRTHMRLFRYFYISKENLETEKQKYTGKAPLFTPEKDIAFYMNANYNDAGWIAGTWKESLKNWTSLEKQVRKNAEYLVSMDEQNKAQEKLKSDSIKQ